jgi:hypothetical protein
VDKKRLLVFGGFREGNYDNSFWILDMTRPTQPIWSKQSTKGVGPSRLINAVMVRYKNFVLVAFGTLEEGADLIRQNEHFILNTNTWRWVKSMK